MTARDTICQSLAGDRYHPEEWIETAQSIIDALRGDGYAIVNVPDIPFKGPRDTNGSLLIGAADKAESARYPVGGSGVGAAVAQVLREVAAAAD